MTYKMEELLPVVGKLAEKYTSFESTSVTYEKAEQLMGAVLYCIRETGLPGRHELAADGEGRRSGLMRMGWPVSEKK